MIPVSRETVSTVSLDDLILSLLCRIRDSFDKEPTPDLSYLNIPGSLLPFLLIVLTRLKTKRCVVSIEDYSLRKNLSESLALLVPEFSLFLAGAGEGEQLQGADIHILNLFAFSEVPLLIVPRQWTGRVRTCLGGGSSEGIKLSSVLGRDALVSFFKAWKMEKVPLVKAPGFYALRGAVVDVFPFGATEPLRLEFSEGGLSSVRTFDPYTQRMIKPVDKKKVFLSAPLKPISEKMGVDRHDNTLDSFYLSVEPSGSPNIYNLQPFYGIKKSSALDLGCVSHRGFYNNPKAFSELVLRLQDKQVSEHRVFLPEVFTGQAQRSGLLNSFSVSNIPFSGAFSSVPLGVFWVSLDHVINLPSLPSSTSDKAVISLEWSDSLASLPWEGPVVHEDLGIGLYKGLSRVLKASVKTECVSLEFKHGDVVHVPLDRLDSVHPYVGSGESPGLTDLRTGRWQRSKQKTRRSVGEVVDQFIQMYGERQGVDGFSFSKDGEMLDRLTETFPFIETVDQMACYEDVRRDMEAKSPMDRLVCGDVGFGKTEVAIRAALKAVADGKQVVLLAPTTILVDQLYKSFVSRLEPFGVFVRHLSRFTDSSDVKKTLSGLAASTVDIVVGTHRLLSKDLSVPNLGLIIVDEEHRFGAKHKEILRVLKPSCDFLSMSATPIPRTLQFSLVGVRDVSTIRTPPPGRLPVLTSIEVLDVNRIKNAIAYEVARGGQVFFVQHNISSLKRFVGQIEELLPDVRVGVAHGRMAAKKLESVMLAMLQGDVDVLISTTIIEAGIDLSNVNTILINNAHRYGLSQLYQMRGRVGRSSRQAYCYLLIPRSDVSPDAHERLRTIQYNTTLGSGYDVALRDLEMRGGGNLFGLEQSGHLATIGFHLYCKIVKDAAEKRKQKQKPKEKPSPVSLAVKGDALIPEDYVQEQEDRLRFYRLLAGAVSSAEIDGVAEEVRDRFGPLPEPVFNLLLIKKIRLFSADSAFKSVEVGRRGATLWLGAQNNQAVVSLVRSCGAVLEEKKLSFSVVNKRGGQTGISIETGSLSSALQAVEYLFESPSVSL